MKFTPKIIAYVIVGILLILAIDIAIIAGIQAMIHLANISQ